MLRLLILIEGLYCGALVWFQVMHAYLALPADRIPFAIVICMVLHCLMSLYYLLRFVSPGSLYAITGFTVYGLFSYLISSGGMMGVFIFGGIGFILLGLVMLSVYLTD